MNSSSNGNLDAEIARLQAMISSPEQRENRSKNSNKFPGMRPRPAATLIVVDGEGEALKVLMGKRNKNLRFMPGALVFPGGSVDPLDGSIPACEEFASEVQGQLLKHMKGRPTKRAARALGLAAIRETAEESGLLIGEKGKFSPPPKAHEDWEFFHRHDVAPSLKAMTLLSRAITPPGSPRRFDTWFFVAKSQSIAHTPVGGFDPCGELEDLQWISPKEAIGENTREITRVMLVELMERIKSDPQLSPGFPAPHYYFQNGVFQRKLMLA